MTAEQRTELTGRAVVLYDAPCGLCNRFIGFCAKRDPVGRIRYVPQQSELGRELLARYGETPEALDAMAILLEAMTPGERFFHHSDAVARALQMLRAPWSRVGRLVLWTPRWLREVVYAGVRRVRYAVFGRYAACPLPGAEIRSRFVG